MFKRRSGPTALSLLLILGFCQASRAASVVQWRHDRKADYTRFVAEFDGPFRYAEHDGKGGEWFCVDVPTSDPPRPGVLPIGDDRVRQVEIQYLPARNLLRLLFRLRRPLARKVETLSGPSRLVVDVLEPGASPPADVAESAAPPRRPSLAGETTALALETVPRPKRLIIDPGHGGQSLGAVSPKIDGRLIKEKDVVLQVGLSLARRVEAHPGMECRLTRREDTYVSLGERIRMAEEAEGDLFISLHCNAAPSRSLSGVRGVEFYYLSPKGESRQHNRMLEALENDEHIAGATRSDPTGMLGKILKGLAEDRLLEVRAESRRMCEGFDRVFRRSSYFARHNRGVKRANFVVLRGVSMPSMLLEIGFISNRHEARRLADPAFQEHVADLVYQAAIEYFTERDPSFGERRVALR